MRTVNKSINSEQTSAFSAYSEHKVQPVKTVHFDLLALPACVNLTDKCKCKILTVDCCLGEKCSFLQLNDNQQTVTKKWSEHLSSLTVERQREIAKKYYGGAMPWSDSAKEQSIKNL